MTIIRFPPVGTRLVDAKGITWTVLASNGYVGTIQASTVVKRTVNAARIRDWAIVEEIQA